MTRRLLVGVISLSLLLAAGACAAAVEETGGTSEERFEVQIRPVLARTCFPCHGGKKTSGGLKVSTRESLVEGGQSGPAIVPHHPEQSLLLRALEHTDESLKMPPGKKLSEQTLSAFTRWVAEGAAWPETTARSLSDVASTSRRHWAFKPVQAIEPPPDPSGWSVHPIDRFIAAKQRAARVRPVAPADRRTLLRRVTFDLIGLPPSPEEIAGFLGDARPDAFARVVERLLASPAYGERWGRHWMDVVRYADTAGDNADFPIPEIARYRDYIIASFNADKPFDEFIREQLAGDLSARQAAPDQGAAKIVATGFLALSRRYATAPYELWHLTLEDTIETTGRAFLGLTLRCARCHDHKYDPITQRDYYALYGIFASTKFPYTGSEELVTKKFTRMNFVPTVGDELVRSRVNAQAERMKVLEKEIAERERQMAGNTQQGKGPLSSSVGLKALRAEHERLRRSGLPPDLPAAYAVAEGEPVSAALQRGGDPARPGAVIPRGVPRFAFLGLTPSPAVPDGASGRAQLAQWITRPDQPLTPRVIVNRVWQHHFGRGIVSTPSNFGLRGERPSHPELLDWLTARFVAVGWSIKDLHRQILLSRTYQLSSEEDDQSAAIDPGNRWFWRFDRRRLDAESIRDAMLAVSGQLDRRRPAPHPFPPIEQWGWTQHNAFRAVFPSQERTVYLMTQRLVKLPYLAIFDGPDTNTSTDVRPRSTVPLQALFLMNNAFVQEQASGLARRLCRESPDRTGRLERAWELAWGRLPAAHERQRALLYLDQYSALQAGAGRPSAAGDLEAWTSLSRVLLTANEFLYVE
jgi:hypothetical protein